jgi:PilZ domain
MKLTDQQFKQMLAGLGAQSIERERRECTRIPMGARGTIISCMASGRHEPASVIVLNVSESGIGVLHPTPMRAGESFILSLAGAAGHAPSAVLCSVMHAVKIWNGMFAIGAQFSRVLSVRNDQPAASQFAQVTADLGDSDLDHVREVEGRLKQLNLP